jgi:glycosyltransferase involved in cell wall biosynthesis
MTLVSVLMTAHNRERYISESIRSVLSSAYEGLELIVVDDCSTDGTFEIAQRFARKDSRVRVYRNEFNLGDYPNRNRAAELAKGRYLKYVDSDDILYPHGLGVMVDAMERFPEGALGISRGPAVEYPAPALLSPEAAYRNHFLGRGMFGHGPLGVIIRADAFRSVGGFSGRRYIGDFELWARLGARFPVVLLPPGLTWWRQHEGQEYVHGQQTGAYTLLKIRTNVEALTGDGCPLPEHERREALSRLYREFSVELARLVKRGQVRTAVELFRGAGISLRDLARSLR